MQKWSVFSLLRRGLSGHRSWQPAWRNRLPRDSYDVVIIGAGGHGLATAYYLAREHGIKNIAVLDKGHLGGGNSGRNTQVCRSNYFYPESAAFYEHSLKLYEGLSHDLNFNIMFSQRGVIELSHSLDELDMNRRWAMAMAMNGIDSEMMSRDDIARMAPMINLDCRFPITGGFIQRRGGIARHDGVVWAFARAADSVGVEIVQNCEVRDMTTQAGRVSQLDTSLGPISAGTVVLCVAGHSSQLAAMVGLKLPIQSLALQAMVTEPVKPVLDTVIASQAIHAYVSQSDRGELVIGGGADVFPSFAQRGSLCTMRDNAAAVVELFPSFSRLRIMRQWAGICDISPDASPIVGRTPLDNLYLSTGWGTGGFKAIPAGGHTLAWTIANNQTHELLEPFQLERFTTAHLIDEGAAAGVAH